jgi:hypothetical protein
MIRRFRESELPQSLCPLESFHIDCVITPLVHVNCRITYHKRSAISSETLLFIEELSVVQIRASYFAEMPSTKLSYIFIDGFVIVEIVIIDLDATTTSTFQPLENLV